MKLKKLGISLLFILPTVLILSNTRTGDRYFEIAKNLDIFASLYKEVNTYYVDEVNPNILMRDGIDAMLSSLDPYTNYIPEDDIEDYRTANTGQYGGIGAVTTNIDGITKVVMLYEGYPAQIAGMKMGDQIIKVNGVDIRGMNRIETNTLMKGQAGTEVTLAIKRRVQSITINFTIKREKVTINHVPYYAMLDDNTGYVKLTEFTMHVGREVKKAVVSLKGQGAQQIILDLRGNPGGLLIEAVNICNVFLPKGLEVVTTKGKIKSNNIFYKTLNTPVDTEIPLGILINSGSASASEIVAGTLQDYDRAVIVGEKSYGKGLVQVSRPLSYNSHLKVTTAKYYTPSGRCIQVIDYSQRNPDGSAGKISDSLKSAFKTKAGRTVYDGGGIDPDIAVAGQTPSPIAAALYTSGLTFDYATEYYYSHTSIAKASQFKLNDEEYDKFIDWTTTKEYNYTSLIEGTLVNVKESAEKEKFYNELQSDIEKLEHTIAREKEQALITFKNQIKQLLEREISSHYYYEKGQIESSFTYDLQLKEARNILGNSTRYRSVLKI